MKYLLSIFVILVFINISAQENLYYPYKSSDYKASIENFGKMWTFDNLPLERWKTEYGFEPDSIWIINSRMAALQFGYGCSGAFVSRDGLIMTNHHCGRNSIIKTETEGEDLLKTGFYAESPEDERPVPGVFVDQLISIEDVTDQIKEELHKGTDDQEKIKLKRELIKKLTEEKEKNSGLVARVITLYNGGKYALYSWKRFNDIRLVMSPEFQIASTGWDWDNFTYPRYEFDFMFFRAYDSTGNPVKSEHFFKFNENGASEDDLIFTIGRPGTTHRITTSREIDYLSNYPYKSRLIIFNNLYNVNRKLYEETPGDDSDLLNNIMGLGNARKVYAGRLMGLRNERLIEIKRDFESRLFSKFREDSVLSLKYGHLEDSVKSVIAKMKSTASDLYTFTKHRFANSVYLEKSEQIIKMAEEKIRRTGKINADSLQIEILKQDFEPEKEKMMLEAILNYFHFMQDRDKNYFKEIFGRNWKENISGQILENSIFNNYRDFYRFVHQKADKILAKDDPLLNYIKIREEKYPAAAKKLKELEAKLEVLNQSFGEAVFELYGDKIPPDATSTLRISEGKIKGYEYNGTLAPGKTTWYGLLDRYYSFGGETYPWGLPDSWKNIPEGTDLSAPVNFVSTNDIVGGNSGSSVINRKGEVIGLVFDGNLESIYGDFLFLPDENRCIAVDSKGLMQALEIIYKTERLCEELKTGKM